MFNDADAVAWEVPVQPLSASLAVDRSVPCVRCVWLLVAMCGPVVPSAMWINAGGDHRLLRV